MRVGLSLLWFAGTTPQHPRKTEKTFPNILAYIPNPSKEPLSDISSRQLGFQRHCSLRVSARPGAFDLFSPSGCGLKCILNNPLLSCSSSCNPVHHKSGFDSFVYVANGGVVNGKGSSQNTYNKPLRFWVMQERRVILPGFGWLMSSLACSISTCLHVQCFPLKLLKTFP